MHWSCKYVGLPYTDRAERDPYGLDCWQLVALVLKKEFAITIPELSYDNSQHSEEFYKGFMAEYEAFYKDWQKVEQPQEGDLLLILRDRIPAHVGIMLDQKTFLHTMPRTGAVTQRLSLDWVQRLDGIYRHKQRSSVDGSDRRVSQSI